MGPLLKAILNLTLSNILGVMGQWIAPQPCQGAPGPVLRALSTITCLLRGYGACP